MQRHQQEISATESLLRNRLGLLWDLFLAKLRHFLFDFSAAKFIFGLYAVLILGGTAVLFLSQAHHLQMEEFNILPIVDEEWRYLLRLFNSGEFNWATFRESLATLVDDLADDGHWGLLNTNNVNLFMDALFTATSAVCLTGMTTCDISVYPQDVIFILAALGAASLMAFALLFNINSYFQTDVGSPSAFSLHDFAEAKKLGRFTLKVMFAIIVLGTLLLTLYLLPLPLLRTFVISKIAWLESVFYSKWIFFGVELVLLGMGIHYFNLAWDRYPRLRRTVKAFLHNDSVYYGSISSLALLLLAYLYWSETPWEQKDFLNVLHNALRLAVSAFTNAGFDTNSGELVQRLGHKHAHQFFTCIIIMLIAFGSLGMQAIRELPKVIYEGWRGIYDFTHGNFSWQRLTTRVSLDTRLILSFNLLLWVGGGIFFYLLEQHNSLSQLTELETFTSTAFQTINMRTAGFTTRVDVGVYSSPTLLFVMLMMLIGGSPNSMSGGMKTTTVAVLLAAVKALLLQKKRVTIFGQPIDHLTVYKAMSTVVLTILALMLAFLLIFSFYTGAETNYLRIAFDVTGAFTTIGLNTGINDWNNICKFILVICMCFGKIGVLVIGMVIFNRRKSALKRKRG